MGVETLVVIPVILPDVSTERDQPHTVGNSLPAATSSLAQSIPALLPAHGNELEIATRRRRPVGERSAT